MSPQKEQFGLSILLIIVIPLLPIIIECLIKGNCQGTNLTITAAIYSVTVLTTSKNLFFVVLSFIPCAILTSIHGVLIVKESQSFRINIDPARTTEGLQTVGILFDGNWVSIIAIVTILGTIVLHTTERYSRHCLGNEKILL